MHQKTLPIPKIAVYSLTRDRLDYTRHCFGLLREKAGRPYDHFAIDNGSKDGTREWLEQNRGMFKEVLYASENMGISRASNRALQYIRDRGCYDIVVKFDNDCEIVTDGILLKIAEVFPTQGEYKDLFAVSPRVSGIVNQPKRGGKDWLGTEPVGTTAIIGGLFQVTPAIVYREYSYPEDLPKAWGQDDHFCQWFKSRGGRVGYLENLQVNHYETTDGQARRYPEYFRQKAVEVQPCA